MWNSINEFYQKIKVFVLSTKENILISLIIIFVGLASFGLGRLSILDDIDSKVDIELSNISDKLSSEAVGNIYGLESDLDSSQKKSQDDNSSNLASVVVASKSGKKYHYPWCSGAKQIAEKNKITFNTIEDARKAGYTPASNCKGLK